MSFLNDNIISDFLVIVMYWLHSFIQQYWLTIIVFTVLIRLVLLPLDLKQKKNSRAMSAISNEVQSLRKRYANNPEQLNAKTKELYAQRGIKPSAGCLPMVIQMILLFAFFGALQVLASDQTIALMINMANEGAQNVQLPSWLWVHNFWQPDSGFAGVFPTPDEFLNFININANNISPETFSLLRSTDILTFSQGTISVNTEVYSALTETAIAANGLTGVNNGWFGLPILAGATLFLTQKISMKNMDPTTAQSSKTMLWMFPIISIVVCMSSNTAFAVYWVAGNLYAMIQSLIIEWVLKRKAEKKTEKLAN